MLHVLTTMIFFGAGIFAIGLIILMVVDRADAIRFALGISAVAATQPVSARRVRVLRSPRLTPLSPERLRAAA